MHCVRHGGRAEEKAYRLEQARKVTESRARDTVTSLVDECMSQTLPDQHSQRGQHGNGNLVEECIGERYQRPEPENDQGTEDTGTHVQGHVVAGEGSAGHKVEEQKPKGRGSLLINEPTGTSPMTDSGQVRTSPPTESDPEQTNTGHPGHLPAQKSPNQLPDLGPSLSDETPSQKGVNESEEGLVSGSPGVPSSESEPPEEILENNGMEVEVVDLKSLKPTAREKASYHTKEAIYTFHDPTMRNYFEKKRKHEDAMTLGDELASVRTYLQKMHNKIARGDLDAKEYELVLKTVRLIKDIVKTIHDIEKLRAPQYSPTNLKTLVVKMVAVVKEEIPDPTRLSKMARKLAKLIQPLLVDTAELPSNLPAARLELAEQGAPVA